MDSLTESFISKILAPMRKIDADCSSSKFVGNFSKEPSKLTLQEEMELHVIEEDIAKDLFNLEMETLNERRRKRMRKSSKWNFWETMWGQLLTHPNVNNPKTQEGKQFRRRFRLPYPLFRYLVELCKLHNIFESVYCSSIPIEAKILGCLRILGRDACADCVNEITGNVIGESTMNYIFKKFIHGITNKIFPLLVKPATGEYLKEVQATYAALGLPGAVGSMDCTHVKWVLCPKKKRFHAKGKEGFPTLAFQVVVDHSRRVQSVSQSFMGATPDKTICGNHLFSLAAQHGSLEHIEYELYNSFGDKYKCRGGYIIVDGGYVDVICFIDPDKYRLDKDAVLWSEWMESVRKDVECFFGIIKVRFRFFRNGIGYHKRNDIEAAFKTVCTLHNMILLFDGIHKTNQWENVDWETLDPEGDDEDDEDYNPEGEAQDEEQLTMELIERNVTDTVTHRPRLVNNVTVFKVTDPKSVLKKALQVSLNVQWIKHKLMWPKAMSEAQKRRMPIDRATNECKRALYHQPSDLRRRDKATKKWTVGIGEGLYSSLSYRRDETIAEFCGTWRSLMEWEEVAAREPWRRGYTIQVSSNGDVLDCYDQYKAGECIASYCNSPIACWDVVKNVKPVTNCRISVCGRRVSLKCGVDKIGSRSPKGFTIPANTELLWNYEKSFTNYTTS